ncbi:MAG: hypothetical protein AAF202_05405 [Pseudomonadota bacterium]
MKTVKFLLLAGLIFVHYPSTQGQTQYSGVVIPKFKQGQKKQSKKKNSNVADAKKEQRNDQAAEVELLRMISPSGNEVVFSLSRKVMGRRLNHKDFKIQGVEPASNSALCQMAASSNTELERAELKLELELMIEELRQTEPPRFLSDTQIHILSQVPLCEEFQLQLTAINKMIEGYDFTELAMTSAN